jgi:hypothetical protein
MEFRQLSYFKRIVTLWFLSCLLFITFSSAVSTVYASEPVVPYSLTALPGNEPGTINLLWYDDGGANTYDIVYGTSVSQPLYGQINIPFVKHSANQDTIGSLEPGTEYYFTLLGNVNGSSVPLASGPVSSIAPYNTNYASSTITNSSLNNTNPYSFKATTASQPGTINLTWFDDGGADKYDLLYGTSPNNFTFGVPNIPFIHKAANQFSVGYLNSNTVYYFLLRGYVNGTGNPYLTGPISATAK